MKTLVIGGIKSGKSRLAESIATAAGKQIVVIATATADDEEMQHRIAKHRESRPVHWQVVEEPLELGRVLRQNCTSDNIVIIDCLTLWLTNLLIRDKEDQLRDEISILHSALNSAAGEVVMVSNETSMGIIPMGELSRKFCDEAGLLHQQISACCDNVVLTVAGLPLVIKGKLNL